MTEDPRVAIYKDALLNQRGGSSYPVFRGSSRYQHGAGFGDVLRGIWRVFFPTVIRGASSFFSAGSAALKNSKGVGEVLKAGIKPALGSMLKSAGKEIVRTSFGPEAAPPVATQVVTQPEKPVEQSEQQQQSGSGRKRKQHGYEAETSHKRRLPSFIGYIPAPRLVEATHSGGGSAGRKRKHTYEAKMSYKRRKLPSITGYTNF
jgi:hypothetical protein